MFDTLINECRTRFAEFGWRRSLFGGKKRDIRRAFRKEGLEEQYDNNYVVLVERGRVVWAGLVQANDGLFEPGQYDLPGNTAFGIDAYFDARPHHLLRICEKVSDLKNTTPGDVVLGKVAAVITDEQNNIANWRLPWQLTDGHAVYLSSTMVHRCRLPGGMLASGLLPMVVAPEAIESNMILPLSCWPPELIEAWPKLHEMTADAPKLARRKIADRQLDDDERDARARPHRIVFADDLVPGASKSNVTLTSECARIIRDLARRQKFRGKWWLKVGGTDGAWTLDITKHYDPARQTCVESQGVFILLPLHHAHDFTGLVIDFKKTPIGEGFVFHASS